MNDMKQTEVTTKDGGVSRRRLLAGLVLAVGGAASGRLWAASEEATAPGETGLSSEGLLAGQPGFQPRTVAPLPHAELPGFLTRAQLAANHDAYVRAVDTLRSLPRRRRRRRGISMLTPSTRRRRASRSAEPGRGSRGAG